MLGEGVVVGWVVGGEMVGTGHRPREAITMQMSPATCSLIASLQSLAELMTPV